MSQLDGKADVPARATCATSRPPAAEAHGNQRGTRRSVIRSCDRASPWADVLSAQHRRDRHPVDGADRPPLAVEGVDRLSVKSNIGMASATKALAATVRRDDPVGGAVAADPMLQHSVTGNVGGELADVVGSRMKDQLLRRCPPGR